MQTTFLAIIAAVIIGLLTLTSWQRQELRFLRDENAAIEARNTSLTATNTSLTKSLLTAEEVQSALAAIDAQNQKRALQQRAELLAYIHREKENETAFANCLSVVVPSDVASGLFDN